MAKNDTTIKTPRVATVRIKGVSPYTQGRAFPPGLKKGNDETHDEFDERVWRERGHYNGKGQVVIPGSAIHKALGAAAKWRNETIPGRGKSTWTKRFGGGCMVMSNPVLLPHVLKDELACSVVHVPSNGQPGGSKRVWRRFPMIEEGWEASVEVVVVDGLINEDLFERHMVTAGKFIGIGTHRPSSSSPGNNGRFSVESISWEECE